MPSCSDDCTTETVLLSVDLMPDDVRRKFELDFSSNVEDASIDVTFRLVADSVDLEFARMNDSDDFPSVEPPVVHNLICDVVRNISYCDEKCVGPCAVGWKHQLDLFLPISADGKPLLREEFANDVNYSTSSTRRPVYFHVHGGGWKRGDRSAAFYGAPSVCRFLTTHFDCVAVAPSYRLGKYPLFMQDVVAALGWIRCNIAKYGGDPNNIILSGHSAGAHIIALLLAVPSRFGPFAASCVSTCVQGVVLLSGVYSLFAPFDHEHSSWKNWLFRKRYVTCTFGRDPVAIDDASPSYIVRVVHGASRGIRTLDSNTPWDARPAPLQVEPKKFSFFGFSCSCGSSKKPSLEHDSNASNKTPSLPPTASGETKRREPTPNVSPHVTCPVLVMNASTDGGLENDGACFADLLASLGVPVQRCVVPGTNHASICWEGRSLEQIASFCASLKFVSDSPVPMT